MRFRFATVRRLCARKIVTERVTASSGAKAAARRPIKVPFGKLPCRLRGFGHRKGRTACGAPYEKLGVALYSIVLLVYMAFSQAIKLSFLLRFCRF